MNRGSFMRNVLVVLAAVFKMFLVAFGIGSVVSLIDGLVNNAIICMFLLYSGSFFYSRRSYIYTLLIKKHILPVNND